MMRIASPKPPKVFIQIPKSHTRVGMTFRYLKVISLSLILLSIAGAAFVKFDTPLAAEVTDTYLRPIFGDRQIVFLEKVFFSFSDSATKMVYNFKKPLAPQFVSTDSKQSLKSSLELNPLPPNSSFSPLNGEGVWHTIPLAIFPDKEVMAYTFVRPDPTRSFAIVSIVKADISALSMGSIAGTVEPGGKVGKYGIGHVPKSIIQSGNLVAAFDGGFQYRDGAYGMIVGNTTYVPLKNGLGTVVGYKNGTVKILRYTGQQDIIDANFVRQNGPMLIEDGSITVTNPDDRQLWGRVVGADTFTWRSGIGLTQKGELVFAAGNNLSPQTLAHALSLAGAMNAMQLDINPHWVRFNIFNPKGSGQYDSVPLNKEMSDGAKEYLNGYQKDFFYLYKR